MPKRILIVGGVAGGASCAARLRRLDETCDIHLFDRGEFVSFANCGLPYHVGNVIPDERKLLVATPQLFTDRFNVRVHLRHEATRIDRQRQVLVVTDLGTGLAREEAYDALVLSPGAAPIRPALPGVDLPGVFAVRTIPDTRRIRAWIDQHPGKRAVVVGGGFIGIEMAENLHARGLAVTILEKGDQVMPPLDKPMSTWVAAHLRQQGVQLVLEDGLTGIRASGDGMVVDTERGAALGADLVILAIGVRPETALAKEAGLTIGPRGGICVDASMRTSDPHILAMGDACESQDVVTGQEVVLPLAGPANRQGRVAAATIAGRTAHFRGVQATAVVGAFGLVAASTGASEKGLKRAGISNYQRVHLHPGHHAGYYPGAKPIHLTLLFEVPSGRILGAQAVGLEGVEKRIDVIAAFLQMGGTVFDLAEAELCYAPQFGHAKDPVNIAGMIAVNHLSGDLPLANWDDLERTDALVVDVREPEEFAAGHIPGAVNAPLSTLRERHASLPKERTLWLCCGVGQRAYYATRFLLQQGYQAANLSGGMATYGARQAAGQ